MKKVRSAPAPSISLKADMPARSQSVGSSQSSIKRNDGWMLDPFAELKPSSKNTPFYHVYNDLPLPIELDNRGKVRGIFNCFNCGSPDHRISDCPVAKNHACIRLNKTWMNQYGKGPTAKSYRPPRGGTRYFEKLQNVEDEDDEEDQPGEEEEVATSGLKIFDSLEEMPKPEKLSMQRAKSISEMEQDERNFQQNRRRGRGRGNGGWGRGNSRHERNYNGHDWRHNNRGPQRSGGWGQRNYGNYGGGRNQGNQRDWNGYGNQRHQRNQNYGGHRRQNYNQQYQPYNNRRRGRGQRHQYF